ncbi:phospholipid phosphatase 1 [Paramormyrops kingsleyae]|uniref:Phospholipid phosphatase 1 n=1 Tax=Paramormyrops kingsleyae TaxID=1676925 RepID=A0A3B3TH57_9TELE|nr:phospholipid phosphatase 1-like [Paramormyrops kingsleyae]
MFETEQILLVLLDILCLGLAGLPFAILTSQHNTFKRGFFCSDDSIRYPFKEDTISYQLLGGVMIPFTLIVLVCGECLLVTQSHPNQQVNSQSSLLCCYLRAIYKALGSFVFGLAMSQSLTDIAKYSIGRLRPHFLAVCQPALGPDDCISGRYIENATCMGDESLVNEARVSFYSGHSSFSMYCMVFLALYLQARLQKKWARLLRPMLQFFLISASVYVGLTRVSDYMHHWSDVLTGLLQGALVAVLIVFFVSDFFKKPAAFQKEPELSQSSLQETPVNGNHYHSTH